MQGDATVLMHLNAVLKNEMTAPQLMIKIGTENYIQLQSQPAG